MMLCSIGDNQTSVLILETFYLIVLISSLQNNLLFLIDIFGRSLLAILVS